MGVAVMSRKGFQVREELKKIWEDDKVLLPEDFGILAKKFLLEAFVSIKAGGKEEEVIERTLEKFSELIGVYAFGNKKLFWQEFKHLYDAGVMKKQGFIDYLIKEHGQTQEEAVEYVAKTFGMKGTTQSAYLSDEFKMRQEEKKQTQKKRRNS
jgi:hypothetical protein